MGGLADVNTTDLKGAIELGCRTMGSVFDADDEAVPFFASRVWPEAYLGFSWAHSEAHVPGRHLNALLSAEDAAGIELDEDVVAKHARAAFLSYGGPVALPLNRQVKGGPLVNVLIHNVREGFHALYALVAYRGSARARGLAEASIAEIGRAWRPDLGWDRKRYEDQGLAFWDNGFITGIARAIGPLVKYYRATGYAPALELALQLAEHAVEGYFPADGAYLADRQGTHAHSTTCVLSSLAQLADLTGDGALLERVRAFYDNGLWAVRDRLGWSIESTAPDKNGDRGEVNNSGDILETALILGRRSGSRYYHDAERMLRGHILPAQLRDVSFIAEPPNPTGEDGRRNVAERHRGAFGFPAPYGHRPIGAESFGFNMDIVGGTVGSLCEAYREVTRFDKAGHWVNLLFDHETTHVEVESPYTHPTLRVRVKRRAPLCVRLPPWVDERRLSIEGVSGSRLANGYLFVAEPPVNRWVTISFPLVAAEIVLEHRDRQIVARLRGDEVVAMENFGADVTFFEPLP